jgi:hypothetical protein
LAGLIPLLALSVPVMAMNVEQEEPMAPFAMSQIDQSRDLSGIMHVRKDQMDELQRRNEIESGKSKARIEELRSRTAFLRDDLEDQVDKMQGKFKIKTQIQKANNSLDEWNKENIKFREKLFREKEAMAEEALKEEEYEEAFNHFLGAAKLDLTNENTSLSYEKAADVAKRVSSLSKDLNEIVEWWQKASDCYEKAGDVAKWVSYLLEDLNDSKGVLEWQNKAIECFEKAAVAAQESSYAAQTNKDKVKWLENSGRCYIQAFYFSKDPNEVPEWRNKTIECYDKAAVAAQESFYEAQTNEEKLEWLKEAKYLYKEAAGAANANFYAEESVKDRLEWHEKADAYRKKEQKVQKEIILLELEMRPLYIF